MSNVKNILDKVNFTYLDNLIKREDNLIEENICINSSIQKAMILGKYSLKNDELMFSLAKIYKHNYSKISKTLGVHKSSVSRFFKKDARI